MRKQVCTTQKIMEQYISLKIIISNFFKSIPKYLFIFTFYSSIFVFPLFIHIVNNKLYNLQLILGFGSYVILFCFHFYFYIFLNKYENKTVNDLNSGKNSEELPVDINYIWQYIDEKNIIKSIGIYSPMIVLSVLPVKLEALLVIYISYGLLVIKYSSMIPINMLYLIFRYTIFPIHCINGKSNPYVSHYLISNFDFNYLRNKKYFKEIFRIIKVDNFKHIYNNLIFLKLNKKRFNHLHELMDLMSSGEEDVERKEKIKKLINEINNNINIKKFYRNFIDYKSIKTLNNKFDQYYKQLEEKINS